MKIAMSNQAICGTKKSRVVAPLFFMIFALCPPASAQQQEKLHRIGYLTNASLGSSGEVRNREAFRKGLSELGYIEGKNISIESRSGELSVDRQRALAAELVRLRVDVVVAGGTGDIPGAKAAMATLSIAMVSGGAPVGDGFVDSLSRPGGNITGLPTLRLE